jgi:hypothetical protein
VTITYHDVSNHNAGWMLPAGSVALVAKCTEGTDYVDPLYAGFRAQAAATGAAFCGYHFLHQGDADAQAQFCVEHLGGAPCMLDVEPTSGSSPAYDDVAAFVAGIRRRGGRVALLYLPRWYWQQIGSPDLRALGVPLVASDYTTYSDTGPGWLPYDGITPTCWQYTDTPADTNAYRGSAEQLRALITGASAPDPQEDDMPSWTHGTVAAGATPTVIAVPAGAAWSQWPQRALHLVADDLRDGLATPTVRVATYNGRWSIEDYRVGAALAPTTIQLAADTTKVSLQTDAGGVGYAIETGAW